MSNNQPPTSKSASECLLNCEGPFGRLSAFATSLLTDSLQLRQTLNAIESETSAKVSSAESVSEHLLSGAPVLLTQDERAA